VALAYAPGGSAGISDARRPPRSRRAARSIRWRLRSQRRGAAPPRASEGAKGDGSSPRARRGFDRPAPMPSQKRNRDSRPRPRCVYELGGKSSQDRGRGRRSAAAFGAAEELERAVPADRRAPRVALARFGIRRGTTRRSRRPSGALRRLRTDERRAHILFNLSRLKLNWGRSTWSPLERARRLHGGAGDRARLGDRRTVGMALNNIALTEAQRRVSSTRRRRVRPEARRVLARSTRALHRLRAAFWETLNGPATTGARGQGEESRGRRGERREGAR